MKTLFAKYNRERLPKFQTVTKIVELVDGSHKAIKQALMQEAQQHIAEIYANYARLTAKYPQIKLVPPTLEDANTVTFPMAQGVSLERLLKQALDKQDQPTFFALLDKFVAYVDSFVTERQVKFVPCDKFKQVFGEWTLDEPQDLIELANVDMIFGNLFVSDDSSITQIDYEWVFDFKIPKTYILWRAIFVLYWMHQKTHQNILILENLFKYVNIKFIDHEFYSIKDSLFQKFVHGEKTKYFLNYKVKQSQIELIDLSIAKYPENSHMQLFYYQHDEINVPDVRTEYFADDTQNKFSFTLDNISDLTHIRIDLTNFPVVANLEYVKLILADGVEHLLSQCYSNANLIEVNSYTYLHDDPINVYYLANLALEVQKIVVEVAVDLQPIKRSESFAVANLITAKQNEKIIQLESTFHQTHKQLQQAEQQAHQLNLWSHAVLALHYDIGNGFNGHHVLKQVAKVGLNCYEFSLGDVSDIQSLRLDPLNLPAHIKLISAQVLAKAGSFYPLSIVWHNANHLIDNIYSFYHDDPIWVFDWSKFSALDYDKVVFEFELKLIEFHELSNFVVQQLASLNIKETELSSTQAELRDVYNSKSWEITKPLRALMRVFK